MLIQAIYIIVTGAVTVILTPKTRKHKNMETFNRTSWAEQGNTQVLLYQLHPTSRRNISAQTYSRIAAKPKIRVLNRFKAQDLKIRSFVK